MGDKFQRHKIVENTTQTYLKLSLLPEAAAPSLVVPVLLLHPLPTNFLSLYKGQ